MAAVHKNLDYILGNWEDESLRDWYAVDEMTTDGRMLRLYVGDGESASRLAAERASGAGLTFNGEPCEPGEFGEAPFYRMTLISPQSAHDFLTGNAAGIERTGEMLSLREAAEHMGVTRQSLHQLVKRGRVEAEMWQGELRIDAASCALFSPIKPGNRKERMRPFQQYELDALLGDFAEDFDVDAIVDELTQVGPDGNRYWMDLDPDEVNEVIARHDISGKD